MVFQLSIPNNAIHSFNCVKQLEEMQVESICSLVFAFMIQESLPTDLGQVANHFQKDDPFVEQCICAITYTYMECIRNEVNPFDFEEVSRISGWGPARISILKQTYEQIVVYLQNQRKESGESCRRDGISELLGLRWRLDVELSNKSLYHTYHPSFVLEMTSTREGSVQKEFFEADYSTLKSVIDSLEQAVQSQWDVCCHNVHHLLHATK